MLWHLRLGHPNFPYLNHVFPFLFCNKKLAHFQCEVSQLAKHHYTSYPSHTYKTSKPFAMTHSDIWGSSCVKNQNGIKWCIIFIDDRTRVCWIYLLKEKSEAEQTLKNFHTIV